MSNGSNNSESEEGSDFGDTDECVIAKPDAQQVQNATNMHTQGS